MKGQPAFDPVDFARIVCQWCGEKFPRDTPHNSFQCQRERPDIDRTEARLRGLSHCTGSKDHWDDLNHYLARPSRDIDGEESF